MLAGGVLGPADGVGLMVLGRQLGVPPPDDFPLPPQAPAARAMIRLSTTSRASAKPFPRVVWRLVVIEVSLWARMLHEYLLCVVRVHVRAARSRAAASQGSRPQMAMSLPSSKPAIADRRGAISRCQWNAPRRSAGAVCSQ